jgi:zearalenone synthase (highly reducing iterative type I polyketide synthase)
MLVDNGARQLCFLSRSGAASAEAKKLVMDLETRNVQVMTLRCDVTDSRSLTIALQKCKTELGTIHGVVQGAIVLGDVLFANMTYQKWVESMRPKVQGTWNIHLALPDVAFFMILSSFAGIFGNRSQDNYAAGCSFQDAIYHIRRGLGQKGVSLDVGLMRDIGVLVEIGIIEALREWEVPHGIRGG